MFLMSVLTSYFHVGLQNTRMVWPHLEKLPTENWKVIFDCLDDIYLYADHPYSPGLQVVQQVVADLGLLLVELSKHVEQH